MEKQKIAEKRYKGYFLMDSNIKVTFDISEEDGGENFSSSLYGKSEFPWEKGDNIWLGVNKDVIILADRIIGWDISEYEI